MPCADCGARLCPVDPTSHENATPWQVSTPGAARANAAIDGIAKKTAGVNEASGYHRRSLAETLMYRLKILTGSSLWASEIDSQATEVSIRAGVLNRMAALARPQSAGIG